MKMPTDWTRTTTSPGPGSGSEPDRPVKPEAPNSRRMPEDETALEPFAGPIDAGPPGSAPPVPLLRARPDRDPALTEKELERAKKLWALSEAARSGKRVLVVMGGAWCPDCVVLDAMMRAPAAAPVIEERFETVKFSVGRYDRNLASVGRLGASPLRGAPAVLILTADGQAVGRDKMYAWRTARSKKPSDLAVALDALSRAEPDPEDTVAVKEGAG